MAIPMQHRDVIRALRRAGANDADIRYYLETGMHPLTSPPPIISAPQEPLVQPESSDSGDEEVPSYADSQRV